MKCVKILALLLLLPLFSFASAVTVDDSGFIPVDSGFDAGGANVIVGRQQLGNVVNSQAGSMVGDLGSQAASSAIGTVSEQVGRIVSQVVQFLVIVFIILGIIVLVWLVVVLIVLRNIMKRDDLSGGEKAAWVLIVLFCGVLPLSPIGILLYTISGGKAQKKEKKALT